MPGELSTKQAKQRYEQYGFIVPENFNYTNNKRNYRVYDTNNHKYINLSLNELNIYNEPPIFKTHGLNLLFPPPTILP